MTKASVSSRILFFLSTLLWLSSCSAPRPDTEPLTVLATPPKEAVYIDLHGTLRDTRGDGLNGVRVTAETPFSKTKDVTNRSGKFRLHALFGPADTVTFHFSSPEQGIDGSYILHTLPKGVSGITLRFLLQPNGRIDHVVTEY